MSTKQNPTVAKEAPKDQGKTNPEGQKQNPPDQKQLQKSIAAAQKVVEAQKTADSLKARALAAVNPKERLKLMQDAYHKEVEAHGHSKYAKRLQSGTWQGGTAGAGIGAGIALGVGGVLATAVGGIVAIPTLLLGGLGGAAYGAIKGPLIKLGGGGDKDEKPMSDEEIKAKAMKDAEELDQAVERGATTVPKPPPELAEAEEAAGDGQGAQAPAAQRSTQIRAPPGAKKPRKLEVRGGGAKKEGA